MVDRARYYLTTSIAYANNKPGLHTLYEVIGADAIARWHRMLGDDTRFLTGTDEHSINIAQAAVDEGRPTKEFVDLTGRRKVKGNMDIELAVNAMDMAPHLDSMVLFSGDGDFRSLVESVQRKGVRVSVVSTISTQPPMVADE